MEDGAFWGACDPQPLQPVGMLNVPDSVYWSSQAWPTSRTDEIPDIALMSPSLVDPLPFDPVLSLPVTGDTVHELAVVNSKFSQYGQWEPNLGSADFYPTHDVQGILNSQQLMHFNSSALATPHLPQDYGNNFNKSFGTITSIQQDRPITSTTVQTSQYGGSSMVPNNRAIPSINSPTAQYGGSPIVPISMAMFGPTVPRGIGTTSGMSLGCSSNVGLMHLPKRRHAHSLAQAGGDVTSSEVGSCSGISSIPGSSAFSANQKSSASVMMPLADSSHMHRMDSASEEPKMASFNPGPYVNSARVVPTQKQQHEQQDALPPHRTWDGGLRNNSSVAIPNIGHRHQQAISNSSPVTSLGFDQRHQAMSNSSSVTTVGFENRHQQALSNSSPVTNLGFEARQKQPSPMGSSTISIMAFEPRQHQRLPISSPIPVMGFEQRQQQSMSNSSPTSNLAFEQRQQPATSTSPPCSNMSFEPPRQPHQQPILTSNASPIPTLARQQPAASSPRSAIADSAESASKWHALRMGGGMGGGTGLPGSDRAPIMMQQAESGTLKCALPRSSNANTSPDVNANPASKRHLWVDDNKNQGGSMNKKPMQKLQGAAGCSRMEEISAAAHNKVTQNTSGRALGPALNTNLKPRARQGSANDPQSIAARVRRERISERLKVLQTLIPNGDKVDMVTMLEKAINYVRCLELQIRMLKNDSLWPKALGPLPATLQELLELAGPEFQDDKDAEETPEKTKKVPEVIEFDGNQPSADRE